MTDSETDTNDPRRGIERRDLLKTVVGVGVGTAVGGLGVGTAAADTRTSTAWPTYRADAANTGFLAGATGPQRAAATDWSHSSGGWPTENVVITDETVYAGARDGTVRAVARDTGEQRWRVEYPTSVRLVGYVGEYLVGQTSGAVFALAPGDGSEQWRVSGDFPVPVWFSGTPFATEDGSVYIVDGDAVVALDGTTGKQQWKLSVEDGASSLHATGGTVVAVANSAVTVIDSSERRVRWSESFSRVSDAALTADTLFVATPGGIRAHALQTGSRRWSQNLSVSVGTAVSDGDALYAGGRNGLVSLAAADGSVRWRVAVSLPAGTIATGAETVYFGSGTGSLVAVDAADGARRWRETFAGPIIDAAVGPAGDVYPAAGDGQVYRLEPSVGATRWRVETGGTALSEPAVGDETVYVGTLDSEVQALSREDGTRRWQVDLDGAARTPAVGDEAVYAATKAGTVYALDAADGSEQWSASPPTADASFTSSPVLANGRLYAGNRSTVDETLLYAFDPANGERVDTIRADPSWTVSATPAVTDRRAFVPSRGTLLAVDLESGDVAVALETESYTLSAPAVADGSVYVAGLETLYAIDAKSYATEWTATLQGVLPVPPVVAGDTVYAHGGYSGTLYALSAADGSTKWTYESETDFNNVAPVAGEKHVYVPTDNGLTAVTRSSGEQQWHTTGTTVNRGLAVGDAHLYTTGDGGVRRLSEAEPPTATFSFAPGEPTVGREVTFDASDSSDPDGAIRQYRWDFDGDGQAEHSGKRPTYTFDSAGTHTVTLRVTGEQGLVATSERTVTVSEPTPTATDDADEGPGTEETTPSDTPNTADRTAPGGSGPGFGVVSALLGVGLGAWRLGSETDE